MHISSVRSILSCESRDFVIFLEAIVNSKILFDASFCEIMGDKLFSLFFSLPTRIAMRSHLLNDIVRDWEQIQLPSEDTSAGLILSQEMPATAVNDSHSLHCTLLEDLVDEGDSGSSSRVHEHENFRIVSQQHVAIQTPWSRCTSPRAGRPVSTNGSHRSDSICICVFVCVFVSFSKRSNKLVFSQSSEKRVSISWALERDVCSVPTSRPAL